MKRCLFLAALILVAGPCFADESEAVRQIRDYYNDLAGRIKNGNLYQREISIAYPVVPAIGTPLSRLVIYYDLVSQAPGIHEINVLKIEHYYQYAGRSFYEECIFSEQAEPVFCYSKSGNGDISDQNFITWQAAERYYFSRGVMVRVMIDNDIIDNPQGEILDNGRKCYTHSQALLDSAAALKIPQPFIFSR